VRLLRRRRHRVRSRRTAARRVGLDGGVGLLLSGADETDGRRTEGGQWISRSGEGIGGEAGPWWWCEQQPVQANPTRHVRMGEGSGAPALLLNMPSRRLG
jgi:hypothetical protein